MLFGLHVLKILYFTQLMQLSEKLVNMEWFVFWNVAKALVQREDSLIKPRQSQNRISDFSTESVIGAV
jgi:hypothetical protein